jgi:hypothetical protein
MIATANEIFNFVSFLNSVTGKLVCRKTQLVQSRVYVEVNGPVFDVKRGVITENILENLTELWWWSRDSIPPSVEMLDSKPWYFVIQLDPDKAQDEYKKLYDLLHSSQPVGQASAHD